MKANLKYYLMVAALVLAVSVSAQALPLLDMQSTSNMMGSGSTLPSAAVSGVQMAAMPGTEGQPTETGARGPMRVDRNDKPKDPFEDPVGAMPWALMALLCGGYAASAAFRRKGE